MFRARKILLGLAVFFAVTAVFSAIASDSQSRRPGSSRGELQYNKHLFYNGENLRLGIRLRDRLAEDGAVANLVVIFPNGDVDYLVVNDDDEFDVSTLDIEAGDFTTCIIATNGLTDPTDIRNWHNSIHGLLSCHRVRISRGGPDPDDSDSDGEFDSDSDDDGFDDSSSDDASSDESASSDDSSIDSSSDSGDSNDASSDDSSSNDASSDDSSSDDSSSDDASSDDSASSDDNSSDSSSDDSNDDSDDSDDDSDDDDSSDSN